MTDARRIVESGYDSSAERYLEWSARIPDDPRLRFLAELTGRLAGGARVLDLGCGAGVPCTALLADGWFLVALGCGGTNGVEDDWLGTPMFFSSHAPAVNRRLLEAAGFTLEVDEPVTMREPEGPATFHWVLARR